MECTDVTHMLLRHEYTVSTHSHPVWIGRTGEGGGWFGLVEVGVGEGSESFGPGFCSIIFTSTPRSTQERTHACKRGVCQYHRYLNALK